MTYEEANILAGKIRDRVSSERGVFVRPVAGLIFAVYVQDPHGLGVVQEFRRLGAFTWAEREDTWPFAGTHLH